MVKQGSVREYAQNLEWPCTNKVCRIKQEQFSLVAQYVKLTLIGQL